MKIKWVDFCLILSLSVVLLGLNRMIPFIVFFVGLIVLGGLIIIKSKVLKN